MYYQIILDNTIPPPLVKTRAKSYSATSILGRPPLVPKMSNPLPPPKNTNPFLSDNTPPGEDEKPDLGNLPNPFANGAVYNI